ncbi:uncharacterized protein B0T23DRAFT_417695 [Neurospora hispaniola]|uniref:Uncharacterized protein n=1 Tax=Neurospora hispaniola TaxID=588809 RepID=A0AAJ0IHD6_9PEZI|nr:hypothetical protein B0T23DRAFT_417695 [Neurospora hispaniola]
MYSIFYSRSLRPPSVDKLQLSNAAALPVGQSTARHELIDIPCAQGDNGSRYLCPQTIRIHQTLNTVKQPGGIDMIHANSLISDLCPLHKGPLIPTEQRKKKVFIFIDGPSGFDLKPPSPAYPKHEDIPRDFTGFCLSDMQPWLKPEPTQLIHFLNYYTDAKMVVTARPEGIFHQTHWKLQLHLEPSLLRHDIRTLCHSTLDHLWFNQRYSFTRKILKECNGSFTEVLDALDRIKRQTSSSSSSSSSDLPPPLPRSELLYSSLLTQFHSSHTKLEIHSLSRILHLLLTDHLYSLYTLRSNRPLSLLQLTFCLHDHLIHNCLLKGSFREPPDIRSTCKSVKKQIQERLYPFITLRKMDHTPIPGDKVDKILEMDCTVPVPESTMEVCFLQSSLVEFLTKTEQGRELLRLDEVDPPRLADVEARREWVHSALIGGSQGGDGWRREEGGVGKGSVEVAVEGGDV